VKAGWQTKSLGEILLKTETVNPAAKPDDYFEYIDVSSVSNETHEIEETQQLKGKDAPSRARRLVKAGDVIFATIRPTLQRIARVPEKLDGQVCSTGYFVMRPSSEVDGQYLFYSLFTEQFMRGMESLQKGASYPAVTDPEVRSQLISYPTLKEQHRIVNLLDEAFTSIATAKANTEKNLQNARELFESHVESIFSADIRPDLRKPLWSVCDLQNGYAFKSGDYIDKSNTLNIRMSSIRPGGTFDPEHNQRFLPDSYAQDYSNFLLKDGDLIIAMTDMAGDPKILGVPTLVNNRNDRNFLMNQRVGKLFGFSDEVLVPYSQEGACTKERQHLLHYLPDIHEWPTQGR
jgi:type I restriction enzyme S subunit